MEHLGRYFNEFAGCHNLRSEETLTRMEFVASLFEGLRHKYVDLVVRNDVALPPQGGNDDV